MRALVLNCTLEKSPAPSNAQALADVVIEALRGHGVEVTVERVVDHNILFGVETDLGDGDDWPKLHEPASVSQVLLERLDAMISETKDDGTYVAYNKVAGVVVTGNEDGAHHVISEIAGSLIDIDFTIPGQAWTYWNMGPGPGPGYTETDHKHDWSESTGKTMAANLVGVAAALRAQPMPASS